MPHVVALRPFPFHQRPSGVPPPQESSGLSDRRLSRSNSSDHPLLVIQARAASTSSEFPCGASPGRHPFVTARERVDSTHSWVATRRIQIRRRRASLVGANGPSARRRTGFVRTQQDRCCCRLRFVRAPPRARRSTDRRLCPRGHRIPASRRRPAVLGVRVRSAALNQTGAPIYAGSHDDLRRFPVDFLFFQRRLLEGSPIHTRRHPSNFLSSCS